MKKTVFQAAVLIGAALVIALVSNAFAGRTRRLVLPGYYPNALKVPAKPVARPPIAAVTTTATVTDTRGPAEAGPTSVPPAITSTAPATDVARASARAPVTPEQPKPAPPADTRTPLQRFPPHPDK